jgi:hypothetical protein
MKRQLRRERWGVPRPTQEAVVIHSSPQAEVGIKDKELTAARAAGDVAVNGDKQKNNN